VTLRGFSFVGSSSFVSFKLSYIFILEFRIEAEHLCRPHLKNGIRDEYLVDAPSLALPDLHPGLPLAGPAGPVKCIQGHRALGAAA
jgi:hypothetical protein